MTCLSEYIAKQFADVHLTEANLHDYQHTAWKFMRDNPFSAIFLDTGLGKTASCLRLMYELLGQQEEGLTLVIGPQRVVNVTWPDEMREWSFGAPLSWALIRDDDLTEAVNRAGQAARRKAKLEGADKVQQDLIVKAARSVAAAKAVRELTVRAKANVHLIHKEMVEFLVDAWGKEWPYRTVIIDESSSLKDHKTNRWKALWRVRPRITRMHQLTATPASESYLYLFAQITLLDQGERLGKSFTKFAEEYFTQNPYTRRYTLRPNAEQRIVDKISDICLVMKQEDHLDLQKPVFSYNAIRLNEEAMSLYNEMERDNVVLLPSGIEVEAETAAALSQKLAQMASGVLYQTVHDEQSDETLKARRVVHEIHNQKIEALAQLVEEVGSESLLVAYYHQSSADRILKAFPQAREMDKNGKLIGEWNAGKVKMLLLHPQANAHGLNLQKGGRHVVFFDFPYSYENYYQLWRRLARQGQELVVVIHHLVAKGTIDEVIIACLKDKCDSQEALFRMIKALRFKWSKSTLSG